MLIRELNSFTGTPTATDYLAIDDGTETNKVPATSLGVSTQMTQAEAEAGTLTDPRVISPSVFKSSMIDIFYPVGSYYETSDTSFNPNTAWGGTWVKEVAGQVHVSAGANYAVNGALTNATDGGEETHKLTANELPHITGSIELRPWRTGTINGAMQLNPTGVFGRETGSTQTGVQASGANESAYKTTLSFGNDQSHNNMQPYIVVNRWHRTA